jgi:2-oxoisovalerate dehydrogenase E1 component
MEKDFFPQKDWILDAIHRRILPLPGRQTVTSEASMDVLALNRLGV